MISGNVGPSGIYISQIGLSYTVNTPSYIIEIYELRKYQCNLKRKVKYKFLLAFTHVSWLPGEAVFDDRVIVRLILRAGKG